MNPPLTHAAFASNLNTDFKIGLDDSVSLEARLTEVSEQKLSATQERFSIIFRLPHEPFLGQGIRRFQHEQMGEFELFLVPISKDDEGIYYEAVFNRMVKTPDSPSAVTLP